MAVLFAILMAARHAFLAATTLLLLLSKDDLWAVAHIIMVSWVMSLIKLTALLKVLPVSYLLNHALSF